MENDKISKRPISSLTILLMLIFQGAIAQQTNSLQDKTPEERAHFQTVWMKSKLSLDSVQVTQAESINLKYAQRNEPVLKSDAGKLAKLKQLKSIQDEKEKELKKVLTPDQFEKYQVIQEEMKEKVKQSRRQ